MWNMTTYKYKLKLSRFERRTCTNVYTQNHMFALKSSTNTKKSLEVGTKNRVGRVSGNKQLRLRITLKYILIGVSRATHTPVWIDEEWMLYLLCNAKLQCVFLVLLNDTSRHLFCHGNKTLNLQPHYNVL